VYLEHTIVLMTNMIGTWT